MTFRSVLSHSGLSPGSRARLPRRGALLGLARNRPVLVPVPVQFQVVHHTGDARDALRDERSGLEVRRVPDVTGEAYDAIVSMNGNVFGVERLVGVQCSFHARGSFLIDLQ